MDLLIDNELKLLDGGFGTTLEDVFRKDISGPLWSAKLIDREPDVIVDAHLAFLRAGSNAILTSTYQCAFETFDRAGYSKENAVDIMRKSVRLAAQAKRKYLRDIQDSAREIYVVLSIGPFGATLSPAQEFDGYYPPPYGPKAYTVGAENTNAFEVERQPNESRCSVNALAVFHYDRLKVFAGDRSDSVWPLIDAIAFETVPLKREILGIRLAMTRLKKDLVAQGLAYKPWWISTVWPSGMFPEEISPAGEHFPVGDVVHSLLHDHPLDLPNSGESAAEVAIPDGIGINCTHVLDATRVLPEVRDSVSKLNHADPKRKPFLILYPNGGNVYDIVNHCWKTDEEFLGRRMDPASWAEATAGLAVNELRSSIWRGVLVGGCCKTSPDHIGLLQSFVDRLKEDSVAVR